MKFVQIQSLPDGSEGANLVALGEDGNVYVWVWPTPIRASKVKPETYAGQTIESRTVYRTVGYNPGYWQLWTDSEVASVNKCIPTEEQLQGYRDEGYVW